MKEKLGQEPAFAGYQGEQFSVQSGMSKRFYAACAAMQGLLSNPNTARQIQASHGGEVDTEVGYNYICVTAYFLADELLKQENL